MDVAVPPCKWMEMDEQMDGIRTNTLKRFNEGLELLGRDLFITDCQYRFLFLSKRGNTKS